MRFRTQLPPLPFEFELAHGESMLFIGSCFSSNIQKLAAMNGFKAFESGFGNVFNPLAIGEILNWALKKDTEESNFLPTARDGQWVSLMAHSDIFAPTAEALRHKLAEAIATLRHRLKDCKTLFITWGTAKYFRHLNSKLVVSNCQKLPAQQFEENWCNPQQIVSLYQHLMNRLLAINPTLKVVITISPVRYEREGLIQNNLSKSSLILAAHQLVDQYQNLHYFPAYELVMDDLRDYRFFETDLVHPNAQAIEYVWNYLSEQTMSATTRDKCAKAFQLYKALQHKPRLSMENALDKKRQQLDNFKSQYPEIYTKVHEQLLQD